MYCVFCLIFENDLKSLLEKVLEKEKKNEKKRRLTWWLSASPASLASPWPKAGRPSRILRAPCSFPLPVSLPTGPVLFLSLTDRAHWSASSFLSYLSSSPAPYPTGTPKEVTNPRDFAGLSQVNTLYSFEIFPATPFLLRRTPS